MRLNVLSSINCSVGTCICLLEVPHSPLYCTDWSAGPVNIVSVPQTKLDYLYKLSYFIDKRRLFLSKLTRFYYSVSSRHFFCRIARVIYEYIIVLYGNISVCEYLFVQLHNGRMFHWCIYSQH